MNGKQLIGVAGLFLLCSSPAFGQNLPPPSNEEMQAYVPEGVIFRPDIAYREGNEAWKLDFYMPQELGESPRPGLVFIHGGGFRAGDKRYRVRGLTPLDWFLTLLGEYAQAGYVVISINYRLSGEAQFPAPVEDVKTAIRWFRAHAQEFNVDPERIGAFGFSAGAQLAVLAALAGPESGLEGDGPYRNQSSALQAVVAGALRTDSRGRTKGTSQYQLLVGPDETVAGLIEKSAEIEQLAERASIISYIRSDAPPLLIFHGTEDFLPHSDVEEFVGAMRAAGAEDVTFVSFPNEGHTAFVTHLAVSAPAMRAFFDRILRR